MFANWFTIALTVGVALIGLIWILFGWGSRRSGRSLWRGIGLILLAVGAWLVGVMGLVANGLRSLRHWWEQQTLDTLMWVGLAVAGLGLLAYLVGGMIAPVTGAQAKQNRLLRDQELSAKAHRNRPRSVEPAPAAAPATGDVDQAEVDRILKERGIQ